MSNYKDMTLEQLKKEYPKIDIFMDWISHHYPDDREAIVKHKMVGPMLMNSQYSNPEIESMIDKLAIFNGWQKWMPVKS